MATFSSWVPDREREQSMPDLVAAMEVTDTPLSCSMAVRTASYQSDCRGRKREIGRENTFG